jgi:hypothetical protein
MFGCPQFFEIGLVPQGIHGRPKTAMAIRHKLAVVRKSLQGSLLPYISIVVKVVEDFVLKDEETAANLMSSVMLISPTPSP